MNLKVAVLIPCYNEEVSIGRTVRAFQAALPGAVIYVYDNNSKDRTIAAAREAGAVVRTEKMQGKGNVVRRMLADVEADVYVLTDGDATYDASAAPMMIRQLCDGNLDMVVGARRMQSEAAYRLGHQFGNELLTGILTRLFGRAFDDILSGYRIFSRRFAKSFPALSGGFEIETEISVHALELKMPVAEVEVNYVERPEGSFSKLSTFSDGFKILNTILMLYKNEKPILFFGVLSIALLLVALILGAPLTITYYQFGVVPRLPTAVLVTGLLILSALSFFSGLILGTVALGRREVRRLAYLSYSTPDIGWQLRASVQAVQTIKPSCLERFPVGTMGMLDVQALAVSGE